MLVPDLLYEHTAVDFGKRGKRRKKREKKRCIKGLGRMRDRGQRKKESGKRERKRDHQS